MDKKDAEFEIDLAKIGMRFGARSALAVALFGTGGGILIQSSYDVLTDKITPQFSIGMFLSSFLLIIGGIVTMRLSVWWSHNEINKLKKDHLIQSDAKHNSQYKIHFGTSWHCKMYYHGEQSE